MGAGVEMDWGAIPRMVKKGHFQKGVFDQRPEGGQVVSQEGI